MHPDDWGGVVLGLLALAVLWRTRRPFPRGVEELIYGPKDEEEEGCDASYDG